MKTVVDSRTLGTALVGTDNNDLGACRDEVARLLNATTCLKHQAALSVAYGAGLRVAEVSMLKVADVDSERMLLRVERGKGGRYRNAMLSEGLLPCCASGGRWGGSRVLCLATAGYSLASTQ
ncbi:hypothetical protein GGD55_002411 [Rhizobium giardinii]|uniref:Tyr recombinase domain-containing protein n=1 Tax=Rhizobium giardinii TaxID=56731 RepID=A0A7W8UBZ0_9HYPH|nr:hypothetical protein [Rhizobium giardinii]